MPLHPRISRAQAELEHALLVAASSIGTAIQEAATLNDIEQLVGAIEPIYDLMELAAQHDDMVDIRALAYAASPNSLVLAACSSAQRCVRARQASLERDTRRRLWAQTLPTGEALWRQAAASESGLKWEGLTFWNEEGRMAWSVTNAYGIDNVAWVESAQDFQSLIDWLRDSDGDIGPSPPMCAGDVDNSDPVLDFHLAVWDVATEMLAAQGSRRPGTARDRPC
ncbi:hypothetical protein A7J71_20765 [Achromobacter insolitus]|nr:hypothetical protein A7J71_20765 [Achromobacter insolitus]OCZ52918.1 hypothetical protein A7P22_16085 [Achromobacter insolitus]